MIKLALAIGFMAVFGLVLWIIVVLLINHFKNSEKSKNDNSQLNNKPNDNITT